MEVALQERTRLRAEWLSRMKKLVQEDERVAAVWLFGSEARGDTDFLSDIDVFVAFQDPANDQLAQVADWLARFGELVSAKELRYNAPEGGRFFEAVYPRQPLPIIVDSHSQPVSLAVLGSDAKILVDKSGLRRADPPRPTFELIPAVRDSRPYLPPSDSTERLRNEIEWFWSNICIVAKHRARAWSAAEDETAALWAVVDNAARLLGGPTIASKDRAAGLQPLMAEMERLQRLQGAVSLGPFERESAYQWVAVSDALIKEGWPSGRREY